MPDYQVHVVDRGTITADTNLVLDGFRTATASDPNPDLVRGDGVVYNLVFDHPEGTVLWDTGSDPDCADWWPDELYDAFTHEDARPIEDDLADAGYSVEDIDAVVQSHLHLDHAGGLYAFEGTDVPVYVHRDELEYAYYSAKTDAPDGDEAYLERDFDRDLNWRVVDRHRHTLFEGLELVHLPGHSPGLLGVQCERGRETLLVVGDQAYAAPNYEQGASMGASLLWSTRDWHESRSLCRELERRHDATVVFGHDAAQMEELGPTL
ncbi:N-acyl homoserine lactonase family protein [Salinirubellus salinus]|jgi:glyoxylase-like metal-dependent hydrolase (beta-lactamase superfamily II)|uniref:N-acyl homoserine lactonase family protein n=1 Tax=Salinirubellus salinus TaxID=1364945 RepID=A0A9E7U5L3_9EURY|nr:N-acyl homoserine lactonase family protein [Salinirubellus salinus]UWM55515.1 N-acyl homoserine lactonase family protein [Salinirubellus salinus]